MGFVFPGLFIGSVKDAFDFYTLGKNQIRTVINVADELVFSERPGFVYIKHGVRDDCDMEDIRRILPACIHDIHTALSVSPNVLVHCLEGKSRSVCVIIAYFVCVMGYDWESALELVTDLHPKADIYHVYLEQTRAFCDKYSSIKR